MEYNELLQFTRFSSRQAGFLFFHYRFDPVPGTGKSFPWKCGFKSWYKHRNPCRQEKSFCFEHRDYIRSKRSFMNLPNPWDDFNRGDVRTRRSWKNKKIEKQWMKNVDASFVVRSVKDLNTQRMMDEELV
jgi:hypothetical protein